MNNLNFTGRIGKDCETSTTQGGTSICSFSVAMKSGYGEREKTTWVKCALFGKRAEGGLVQYLTKGQEVAISGEATLETWEKDDKTGAALKCNVNQLTLIGAKNSKPDNYAHNPSPAAPQAPNMGSYEPSGGGSFDDDIPFAKIDSRIY